MTPVPSDSSDVKRAIRERVVALAARRGVDASSLKDADVISESGTLDSASILELIMWCEMTFGVTIEQSDLTVETFGTIDAMARRLERG